MTTYIHVSILHTYMQYGSISIHTNTYITETRTCAIIYTVNIVVRVTALQHDSFSAQHKFDREHYATYFTSQSSRGHSGVPGKSLSDTTKSNRLGQSGDPDRNKPAHDRINRKTCSDRHGSRAQQWRPWKWREVIRMSAELSRRCD